MNPVVPRLLILGGTAEARRLAELVSSRFEGRLNITTSLAGRTARPRSLPGDVRIGGFGGAEGLAAFIAEEGIGFLVDATHPFASQMPWNALEAARRTGVERIRLERPAWRPGPGDNWRCVGSVVEAAALLPSIARHALVTIGAQEIAPFASVDGTRITARMIETDSAPTESDRFSIIVARGPFDLGKERALIERHGIDAIVTKNAGGDATAPKLRAAREAGIPVVMVERPPPVPGERVETPDSVSDRIEAWLAKAG